MDKIVHEDLVKITSKETGEDVFFSNGTLTIIKRNQIKDWEVTINGIEEFGYLLKILNGNPLSSEFTCKDGKILYGDAILSNIDLGAKYINLKGTGPIRYKENDEIFSI